jgi:hypothetical protein
MASPARGWKKTAEGWTHADPRMQQIIFQIQAGRPHADIAGQFSISLPRISRIRRKLELPDKRFGQRTTQARASI